MKKLSKEFRQLLFKIDLLLYDDLSKGHPKIGLLFEIAQNWQDIFMMFFKSAL